MAWPENHLDPGMWRVGSCSTCCEGMARTEDRRGWVEVGLSDMRLARAATNRHHDHVGLLPRLGSRANRDKSVRIAGTVLGYKSMSAPSTPTIDYSQWQETWATRWDERKFRATVSSFQLVAGSGEKTAK
jgi:hypothetical protein